MASHVTIRRPEEGTPEQRPNEVVVEQLLVQILESPPFRTSKQCKNLLRYIVEHSLHGDDTALRERVIGNEVFGRDLAYDTNEDPVVRMRAADVRKRLAQFYQALDPGAAVWHIELQPGSYRAHFRNDPRAAGESEAETTVKKPSLPPVVPPGHDPDTSKATWLRRYAGWVVAIAALVALAVSLPGFRYFWPTPQDRFWAPITRSKPPVLIYIGSNVAYIFTSDFLSRYRAAHQLANTGPEIVLELPPKSSVRAEDLLAMKDTFVTNADTSAVVQLTTQLRDWNKPFMLRSGGDLSVGDLRNRPSILVGAFNNSWTMELTHDLPFSFREGTRIQEKDHPSRSWSVSSDAHEGNTDDYALITRLLSSKTGGPCIVIAGIGQYGTQAAAEFVTNADRMSELLKSAPRGWQSKNMQVVLHVKAMDFQPMGVDVVAASYW